MNPKIRQQPMMASYQTTLVFFLAYLSIFSSLSSASAVSPHSDSNKVSLGLYYESLCPYSANFIVNYLAKLVKDDDLLSIVDVYLSPWGNAKIRANDTFVCQHGPKECLLNTVEACAIHVWPKLKQHFAFIDCIETFVYKREYSKWELCFDKLNLDPEPIVDCYSSGYGKELELKYAAETNALEPPHKYVPWVVVDGQPLYEDYENYISYICKAYRGTATPKACSRVSHRHRRRERHNKIIQVCYNERETSNFVGRIRSAILKWMQQINGAGSM